MLFKTVEFHKKFLNDLSALALNQKKYLSQLDEARKKNPNLQIGYKKQLFTALIFTGSYGAKEYGKVMTDIDIFQIVNFDPQLMERLKKIFSDIDKSNFIFLRLYCGKVKQLRVPWNYNDIGGCKFDIDRMNEWLEKIKPFLEDKMYIQIDNILSQDSLSLQSLLEVEKILEPVASIVWIKEDIINGFKIINDEKYDLLEIFKTSTEKKLFKFIYVYKTNEKTEYCPIDISLKKFERFDDRQEDKTDLVSYQIYYSENTFKKIQTMRRGIDPKDQEAYSTIVREIVHPYSGVIGRFDLIDKAKRYKALPDDVILKLEQDLQEYTKENNIKPSTATEIEQIIRDRAKEALPKVRKLVRPKFKFIIFMLNLRAHESKQPISKEVIKQRLANGNSCPFFPVNSVDVNLLYSISKRAMLDPRKVLTCLYESCLTNNKDPYLEAKNLFKVNNMSVNIEKGQAVLKKGNEVLLSVAESDLVKLQPIVLWGE